jgi:hypothetical protein
VSRGAARADPGASRRSGRCCAAAAAPLPFRLCCANQGFVDSLRLLESARPPLDFAGSLRDFAQFSAASRRRSSPRCAITAVGFASRSPANQDSLESPRLLEFARIPLETAGRRRESAASWFNSARFSAAGLRPSGWRCCATFVRCAFRCRFARENSLNSRRSGSTRSRCAIERFPRSGRRGFAVHLRLRWRRLRSLPASHHHRHACSCARSLARTGSHILGRQFGARGARVRRSHAGAFPPEKD